MKISKTKSLISPCKNYQNQFTCHHHIGKTPQNWFQPKLKFLDSPFLPPPNFGYCTTCLLGHQTGPLARSKIGHISDPERQQLQSRPRRWGLSSSWGLATKLKLTVTKSQLSRPIHSICWKKPHLLARGYTRGCTGTTRGATHANRKS